MDDEEYILKVTSYMLKHLGYEYKLAKNSKEAVQYCKQAKEEGKSFDFIIMDLTIPGEQDTYQTASEILKIDPYAKIIVCSGYVNNSIMSNYSKYGFKGRLLKPFGFDDLKTEINRILSM